LVRETALEQLVRDSAARVELLARRILHGRQTDAGMDTGDLVGDSYLKFMQLAKKGLKETPASPRQWFGLLSTIIRNVLRDELARRRGRKGQVQYPGTALPEDVLLSNGLPGDEAACLRADCHAVLDQLSEDDQLLMRLRYYYDMADDEIAQVFERQPDTIKKKRLNLLVRLGQRFAGLGPDAV
jgi:RNA polymerase sigma factor (sigma-70 family)